MTKEIMEAEEIAVIFHTDGTASFSRGIINTEDYSKIKQVFIMPADSPMYRISDYWGYNTIHESWKEVKP